MLVHSDYGAEDLAIWLIAAMFSTAAAAAVTVLIVYVIVYLLVNSNAVIVAFDVYAAVLTCRLPYSYIMPYHKVWC